jgi:hypothetical protein
MIVALLLAALILSYWRRSLSYGYVGMSYWQDCGWSDRTLELRRDCAPVRPVRNRRSHRGFSFPDPRPHSVLKSIFKAQSSRRLYPAPSKFGLMRKTEQQAFPRLPECTTTLGGRVAAGQHSLENLLTCSFRHCAFIFCPKHQRGRLLGCSALEATGS